MGMFLRLASGLGPTSLTSRWGTAAKGAEDAMMVMMSIGDRLLVAGDDPKRRVM